MMKPEPRLAPDDRAFFDVELSDWPQHRQQNLTAAFIHNVGATQLLDPEKSRLKFRPAKTIMMELDRSIFPERQVAIDLVVG